MKITQADKDRFFKYVYKSPDSGCWLWLAYINYKGHGQFWIKDSRYKNKGKMEYAHRISYIIHNGPIPLGKVIDHVHGKCKNKHCVNPDHLEAVSSIENTYRSLDVRGILNAGIEEDEYNEYARDVLNG